MRATGLRSLGVALVIGGLMAGDLTGQPQPERVRPDIEPHRARWEFDPSCSHADHYYQIPNWQNIQWARLLTVEPDWTGPAEVVSSTSNVTQVAGWEILPAHDCRFVECGQTREPIVSSFTMGRDRQICVTFGASFKQEVRIKIGNALVGELGGGPSFGYDFGVEGCWGFHESRTFEIETLQCEETRWRQLNYVSTAVVKVPEARERRTFLIKHHGSPETHVYETFCQYRESVGSGQRLNLREFQLAPPFDPDEVILPDDAFDGQRSMKCCEDPPDGPPCCGCVGDD